MSCKYAFIGAIALACISVSPVKAQNVAEYFAANTPAISASYAAAGKPMQLSGASLLDGMRSLLGARRSPTGFRGPWCGDVLGFVARRVGASVPRDYRLAAAWARAGRATSPHVGAVAVMRHHVGVIASVSGNRVLLVSGNHGHRVAEGWYPLSRMIAIRSV